MIYKGLKKIFSDAQTLLTTGEDTIRSTIEDPILKAELSRFPILKYLYGPIRFYQSMKAFRIRKNAETFLLEIMSLDDNEKGKLWEKLEAKPDYAEEFSEAVFYLMESSIRPVKLLIAANLIKALSVDKVTLDQHQDLMYLLEEASMYELKELKKFNDELAAGKERGDMDGPMAPMGAFFTRGARGQMSEIGKLMYQHGMQEVKFDI